MGRQTLKSTMKKIDLSRPFMVLKSGKVCRKPYHRKRFLYFEKTNPQTRNTFLDTLQDEVRLWDNGSYSLRAPQLGKALVNGTTAFARFEVQDGKVCNPTLSSL